MNNDKAVVFDIHAGEETSWSLKLISIENRSKNFISSDLAQAIS